jgi:ubiquinone/menaquinone biosynthesis C-methylase UbiE
VAEAPNICAGPFGAVYDFYIERPWLMRLIGRVVWGIDASVLYASMAPVREAANGSTILDVPCGGGVAFRDVAADRDVRYIAVDLSEKMLTRAKRRARTRALSRIEYVRADMTVLPFPDEHADLILSYSGLHMVGDPERAVQEIARCLKPGGRLIGTTFIADGTRRARALFAMSARRGHPIPPSREDLGRWFTQAGIADLEICPQHGFAAFSGHKEPGASPSPQLERASALE